MTNKRPLPTLVSTLLLCWAASSSQGSIYVPAGLSPGDKYHLAFVTDGRRDALSTSIADYNAFVQSEAERSTAFTETFGIDWFAIASTHDVDARDNALVSAPVYLLDGTKIADGFATMWDGDLDAPLSKTQFLTTATSVAATGTYPDGSEAVNTYGLGSVTGVIIYGSPLVTDTGWIAAAANPSFLAFPLYALSEELEVPADGAVPEAASIAVWLCLASLVGLVGAFRRWTA